MYLLVGYDWGLHPTLMLGSALFWYTRTWSILNWAGSEEQNCGLKPQRPSTVLQSNSLHPRGVGGNPHEVDIAVLKMMYDGSLGMWVWYGSKPSCSIPNRNLLSEYQCTYPPSPGCHSILKVCMSRKWVSSSCTIEETASHWYDSFAVLPTTVERG